MSNKKYTGILAKLMVWHSSAGGALSGLEPPSAGGALSGLEPLNQNLKQLDDRIKALYEYFEIDQGAEDSQFLLLVMLAAEYVPGFRWKDFEPSVGSPSKWRGEKSAELYADVKFLMSNDRTASGACRVLATAPKYAERYNGERHANLRRRFYEAPTNMDSSLRTRMTIDKSNGKAFDEWMIKTYSLCGKD